MSAAPSFDEIFAVMAAASVGDRARVTIPDSASIDDPAMRLAIALNVLLDDLAHHSARVAANEARFRAIIEKSHDGIILVGGDGKVSYASPMARVILGRGPDEPLELEKRVHASDRSRFTEARNKIWSRPGASEPIEFRIELPGGETRWVQSVGTNLLHDPDLNAVVINFRDVTESRAAVDALRVSETRFTRLAQSGLIGIVVADVFGNTIEANDAYLKMLGYTRDELERGKIIWTELTPHEWRAADEIAIAQLKDRGVTAPYEKELFRTDGMRVPVLMGVATLDYPQVIGFVADMSERRRAEEQLRRTEEQLRQTQKMDAVGRLAGGMAHDFNNVLSVILSYAGLMIEDVAEADPLRADLDEIKKAAERAANLTRQLLLFSRQKVLQPKVVDLNDALLQMEKMLRRLVGEDVRLTLTPASSLGHVKIDPGHVEQVVMNLVVNARDAMPTGGQLTIETANVMVDQHFAQQHYGVRPGPHVMLAVTDTGIGMDKATQARIFEPFFTTKSVGKGTGLGLSTVFGIVQQSGGSVWVYSEVGRGTTFKIYLPRVDDAVDAVRARGAQTLTRGSETILLVEDEPQVRVVARGILAKSGYHVLEARDGGEALLLTEAHLGPIHLLLTDVVMPSMSGPELAKRLLATHPELKVLCMSGYTDDSVVRHGVLDAKVAFVQKPFTPESLTRRVRETLDGDG